MEDFISALFGAPPDYSNALTPQQSERMRSNALTQGGIGALISLLGASGQTTRPISTGQALAGALGAGYGGYQSSFDNTLKQLLTAQQLGENKRKLERQALFEQAMQGATTMQPQQIPMSTGAGSQLEMLSRPEFGGDMAATETGSALRANLPTTPTVDFNKLVQAISIVDPIEAAKLMAPKETKLPGKLGEFVEARRLGLIPETRTFEQFKNMDKGPLVQVMPAEGERQKGYGKFGVEQNTAIFEAGQSAVNNIAKINETLKLIEQGTPTTGLGADLINNINRTKLLFTDSKKNIKEVSDTELLNSLLGADVFPQIGALGIGARGLDTPAEREFLREVMTGTINMNKDTLLRLTNLRKKYEEKSLNQYNRAVEEGQLDDLFQFSGLPKRKLTVPKSISVNY